ncbi:MAG: hypothetical protein IPH18_03480 [Chitinophagaceae bacterium]|nr:hypothetical protein [Chitinophagaceae bacterium]
MRYIKWLGIVAFLLLVIACFLPWIAVAGPNISAGGMDAGGTNFGKPGVLHLILGVLFLALHLIPRLWAKRVNVVVAALNIAWAVRNFFILAICRGGECPDRLPGFWLMLVASVLMLITALFPDMEPIEKD